METVIVIAVVVACLAGWLVVSLVSALLLGRMIARAKRVHRAADAALAARVPAEAFTPAGVAGTVVTPERATIP